MADDSGYSDDAGRIERDYVPPNASTKNEVVSALEDAGFPDASIDHIAGRNGKEGWLQTEVEGWSAVDSSTQSASEIARSMDRQGGTISQERARSIGDDIEQDLNRAKTQAIAQSGQIDPSERGVSDRSTPVSAIRDRSGEVVAVAGGYDEDREAIADETGARSFDSLQDLQDSISATGDGSTTTVEIDGQVVRRFSR